MNWISIEDKLPDEDGKYFIFAKSMDIKKPFLGVAWYDPKFGWSGIPTVWIDAISHWTSFPKPPKIAKGK